MQIKLKTLITVFIFTSFTFSLHAQGNDFMVIKKRIQQLVAEKTYRDEGILSQNIEDILFNFNGEGNWTDINYNDSLASAWSPSNHWYRLLEMAYCYKNEGTKYYKNKELLNQVKAGIQFWLKHTPVSKNYWWNAIGVPLAMGEVLILMEPDLERSVIMEGARLMKLGVKPDFYNYHGKATGQNLLWMTTVHIYACCLENDQQGMRRAFDASAGEIKITEGEGIQPDFSFHQHGAQLYSFGYGRGFSLTAAKLMYLARNTVYAFSPEKMAILSRYVLDGQQWLTRNQFLEYTAMGREISRGWMGVSSLVKSSKLLMEIDTARKKEYRLFIDQLESGMRKEPLIGNRYFPYSDLMVHQRKNYYFSLKSTSSRMIGSESGNGENLKGFYQGSGTTYLVRSGNEYKNIFPMWNWRQLPGLLTEQTNQTLPLFNWGDGTKGATDFVYGLSNGRYGCFGYDYQKENVTAKRAWFFFDDEIVNMVGNLNFSGTDDFYQALNQCFLQGTVVVDDKAMQGNKNSYKNASRVFHDSVAYVFDKNPHIVQISTGIQKGAWHDINVVGKTDSISAPVFALNINLGKHLQNAGYAYAILPGISLKDTRQYDWNEHLIVIQNDSLIQAIFHKKLNQVQAVFYKPGKMKLPWNNKTLTMEKPGLVMLILKNGKMEIEINQPPFRQFTTINIAAQFVSNNGFVLIN